MNLCKLRQKEVVDIKDGKSLGYICDMVFDVCSGCISAIIVPGGGGLTSLFGSKKVIIPWRRICKIGEDVILVELAENCE